MENVLAMWQCGDDPVDAEAGLIDGARRGESAALETLYRRHSAQAYSLALRVTGQRDRAEDVVQEAFLRAFERVGGFRGEAPFGAWLKRVVVNIAIDRLRAERRLVGDDSLEMSAAPARDADRSLDALGLLQRLSTVARTVLVLHDLEGYSHVEIAGVFGNTESWSKSQLSRARARLGQWLQQEQIG